MSSLSGDLIFYDGGCALCHAFVRFVVMHDKVGRFHFAPLGGTTFQKRVGATDRAQLPDSIVLQRASGQILTKSAAVLHVMKDLGGLWKMLTIFTASINPNTRDRFYDAVAKHRRRAFGSTTAPCPMIPAQLSGRFLD